MLPVLLGCSFYTKLNVNSRFILFLVITSAIPQLARAYLGRTSSPVLNYFYNINIPIEFFLSFLFFQTLFKSAKRKSIFYVLACAGFIFGIVSIFYSGIANIFLSNWVCFNNLIFTAWILLLLLELFETDKYIFNKSVSIYWYIIGLFFYSSCTVLIFSLWHYIKSNENSFLQNLWNVHDLFNTLMYLAFSIGFVVDVRNGKKQIKT